MKQSEQLLRWTHCQHTTDIHKHNCEELQQKNRRGTVSNKLLGA